MYMTVDYGFKIPHFIYRKAYLIYRKKSKIYKYVNNLTSQESVWNKSGHKPHDRFLKFHLVEI